jgi:hypothetical protein
MEKEQFKMIWVFWTLLGLVIAGMLMIAIPTRRGRPRHKAVPVLPRLRSALGISFGGLLWHTGHPYDVQRRAPDAPRDYARDFEENWKRNGVTVPKNDDSPNS